MAVSKWAHADTLDNGPKYIKDNCTRMVACSGTSNPADYAAAVAATLADVTMASGDFTLSGAAGAARVNTIAAKTGVTVDASGTFSCVCLLDVSNTKLLLVTTGTSQVLTAGNTCDFPSWTYTAGQPT